MSTISVPISVLISAVLVVTVMAACPRISTLMLHTYVAEKRTRVRQIWLRTGSVFPSQTGLSFNPEYRRKFPCFTAWISNTNYPRLQVAQIIIHSLIFRFFNNKSHLSLTAKSESDTSYANLYVSCPWSVVRCEKGMEHGACSDKINAMSLVVCHLVHPNATDYGLLTTDSS